MQISCFNDTLNEETNEDEAYVNEQWFLKFWKCFFGRTMKKIKYRFVRSRASLYIASIYEGWGCENQEIYFEENKQSDKFYSKNSLTVRQRKQRF